jgi:large subunit ribosomal protein LP0
MAIKKYPERKVRVLKSFLEAFCNYDQVILVNIMNISTSQITKTRKKIRERGGCLIIGKNKIALKAIQILTEDIPSTSTLYELSKGVAKKPQLKAILPHLVDKQGFVFSNDSYLELKPILEQEVEKSPAKAGTIAPSDIWLQCGSTNQDPGKIGEFQNLGI